MTEADHLPPVLDKFDFAKLLKKSPRTIDRLRRARVLPAPLIPGHSRWSREAVLRWLAGRRREQA